MLNHFSLFTGIGGLDLAAEWAGFETVGQCEWADYPTKVLEKHWPDVPKWRDIRSVTKESVENRGIRAITVISGGFPCQPFSVAGNRKGEEDDRFLWPEMLRVIQELQPAWVLGENVFGIINMALDQVLSDLENLDYSTEAIVIPACSIGALHRRDRTFIIANTNSARRNEYVGDRGIPFNKQSEKIRCKDWNSIELVNSKVAPNEWFEKGQFPNTRPLLVRKDDGFSDGMDRLHCLGNAVVPQQAYPIFQAIADIENGIA